MTIMVAEEGDPEHAIELIETRMSTLSASPSTSCRGVKPVSGSATSAAGQKRRRARREAWRGNLFRAEAHLVIDAVRQSHVATVGAAQVDPPVLETHSGSEIDRRPVRGAAPRCGTGRECRWGITSRLGPPVGRFIDSCFGCSAQR